MYWPGTTLWAYWDCWSLTGSCCPFVISVMYWALLVVVVSQVLFIAALQHGKSSRKIPLLTCCCLSWHTRVKVSLHAKDQCCCMVHNVRLYVLRTLTKLCNDSVDLDLICTHPLEQINTKALYQRLGITLFDTQLRSKRLRWYGHVCRSETWAGSCTRIVTPGAIGREWPKNTYGVKLIQMTWKRCRSLLLTPLTVKDGEVR